MLKYLSSSDKFVYDLVYNFGSDTYMLSEKTHIRPFRDCFEERSTAIHALNSNSRNNKNLKEALEVAMMVEGKEGEWKEVIDRRKQQLANPTPKKRKRPNSENASLKAIQQQKKKLKEEEKIKREQEKLRKMEEKKEKENSKKERERAKEERAEAKERAKSEKKEKSEKKVKV